MTYPIGIDFTAAAEQGGGIGRYTRELITALGQEDTDTEYRLFVAGFGKSELPPPPGKNFEWRSTHITAEWFARIWHRARLPIPVETWTGSLSLYHATDFTLPPLRRGTRSILTVHDLSFIRSPETAMPSLRRYLEVVVPRSIQRADFVLADSEATRQDILELYQVEAQKIAVLYSGVEKRFKPIRDTARLAEVRSRYGLGDTPFILSVGTVQPRKNYQRLAEAFKRLNMPDLRMVIAGGKGWLDTPLYQSIRDLGIEDRVKFLGFVADADLPALYSSARVLALPSLYEGFGLPALEAMACGLPVVATNVSSVPEVVGEAGLQIDPTDVEGLSEALRRLIEEDDLRNTLIARGIERAKLFDWRKSARELQQHYTALLDR
jgi:glycosyltransferase involved in cell wall biosynthesis